MWCGRVNVVVVVVVVVTLNDGTFWGRWVGNSRAINVGNRDVKRVKGWEISGVLLEFIVVVIVIVRVKIVSKSAFFMRLSSVPTLFVNPAPTPVNPVPIHAESAVFLHNPANMCAIVRGHGGQS